jgi:hypothetical protein
MINNFILILICNLIFIYSKPLDYDQEEKDNIVFNKTSYEKFMEENRKNGYILYTNELIDLFNKIDENGEKFPVFCLVIINNNDKSQIFIKELKLISEKINNCMKSYLYGENNTIDHEIIFILINFEEKSTNEELKKFLRNISTVTNLPSMFFLCRKKQCSNEKCQKSQKSYRIINKYFIFNPLNKFIDILVNHPNDSILVKILEHGFKKN